MEDHHVDRLDVEAQQCVKLTSTNYSIDLKSHHEQRLKYKFILGLNRRRLRLGFREKVRGGQSALPQTINMVFGLEHKYKNLEHMLVTHKLDTKYYF